MDVPLKQLHPILALVLLFAGALTLSAQNPVPRPLRFYETFEQLNVNMTETKVLQMATNFVNYGYAAAGWDGILIDEPWLGGHDANGNCYANSNTFPHGMLWLVSQLHALGLKAGLFFTLGHKGVVGPGSWGYWEQDATNAAKWNTDFVYLVVDDNGYGTNDGDLNYSYYQRFISALQATGSNVTVMGTTHQWEPWLTNSLDGGQLWVWPGYVDFNGTQSALLGAVDNFPTEAFAIQPGHYLMYGWFGQTIDYYGQGSLDLFKSLYGMMALWHSPLSCAFVSHGDEVPNWKSVHTNQLLLALDADAGVFTPTLVAATNQVQAWSEPLGSPDSGQIAVAFLNRSASLMATNSISVPWTNFGLPDNAPFLIQDVWGATTYSNSLHEITATVPPYGCNLYLVTTPPALGTITTASAPVAGGTTAGGGAVYVVSSRTVSATPNANYFFANWTENGNVVSTSPAYNFLAATNRTLVANFGLGDAGQPPTNWTVTTISAPAAGGETGGGGSYTNGQNVTVCAVPAACRMFVNWTEGTNVVSPDPCYTFLAQGVRHLTANFIWIPLSISTAPMPASAGNTSGGGLVNCGSGTTVSAAASPNYQFVNWTENGNVVATAPDYSFTPTADRALVANFLRITCLVSLASVPWQGGSTGGGGVVNSGDTVTVTAATNRNFLFLNWSENGAPVSATPSYTFTVTSNRSLVANFLPLFPLLDLGTPVWDGDGFNLTLAGPVGSNYWIESTTNLLQWQPLTNFLSTNSPSYFSDPAAPNFGQRFYRARMQSP